MARCSPTNSVGDANGDEEGASQPNVVPEPVADTLHRRRELTASDAASAASRLQPEVSRSCGIPTSFRLPGKTASMASLIAAEAF